MNIQLDLFEENDDISLLRKEIKAIKDSNDKVRRGFFAKHNELMKLYISQQEELDRIRALFLKQVK